MIQITNKKYKVPFDNNGNLIAYVYAADEKTTWKEPFDFVAIMIYDGYSRGRSSAVIKFKTFIDNAWRKYPMFLSDFDDMMKQKGFDKDGHSVTGTFTFVKKGQNYGIKYVSN